MKEVRDGRARVSVSHSSDEVEDDCCDRYGIIVPLAAPFYTTFNAD
jgi:hypothetical protein